MKDHKKDELQKPTLITRRMKKYEEEILHKLPNEFRWALKDYNYHNNSYYYSGGNEDYNFD